MVCPSWGLPKYIETKVLTICFYLLWNFFERKKRCGLEEVSLAHFLYVFWRKIFLMIYSNWQNWIAWMLLLLQILGDTCIENVICFPVYDALIKRTKNDQTKICIRLKYLEIKTSRNFYVQFAFTPLRYPTYF